MEKKTPNELLDLAKSHRNKNPTDEKLPKWLYKLIATNTANDTWRTVFDTALEEQLFAVCNTIIDKNLIQQVSNLSDERLLGVVSWAESQTSFARMLTIVKLYSSLDRNSYYSKKN